MQGPNTANRRSGSRLPRPAGDSLDQQLAEILRQRAPPLVLVIDDRGDLLYSSLGNQAGAADEDLCMHAVASTRELFEGRFIAGDVIRRLVIDQPGQRCALVMVSGNFYGLRLFPLHAPMCNSAPNTYTVLVERIVGGVADVLDVDRVREAFHLSRREIDVLREMMSGGSDKAVAISVGLSVATVRGHLKSIRAKLGVTTRTAIVNRVHQLAFQSTIPGSGRT